MRGGGGGLVREKERKKKGGGVEREEGPDGLSMNIREDGNPLPCH